MTVNGRQFRISDDRARVIVSEVGATLRVFESGGLPYVESFREGEPPPRACGAILVPWPNRVKDGRWTWQGQEQQLAISEPLRGNALHGLVRYSTWQVVSSTKSVVTLETRINVQPGWPVPLRTTVRYALDREGLRVTHTVTNIGDSPVPFGLGMHCYPRAGNTATDHCALRLAATTMLPVDAERKLPVSEPTGVFGGPYDFSRARMLTGAVLDTSFGGCMPLPDDRAELVRHLLSGADTTLEVWTDPAFRWVQVSVVDSYPGRGRAVAVEPMTCPPDALRSGVDLIWLAPDETWTAAWGLRPLPVAATS